MNFYSCYDLPRAEARIHEKKSNYLKAILENHQNRSTINWRQAAHLPYLLDILSTYRGLDIGFFPLGSIPLTHCCYNIVDTPFTKTVLDFSRKISKEKNDILLDLQTLDKNTHQYIFSKIKMYDFFHILAFPYIKKEHLPICYTQ